MKVDYFSDAHIDFLLGRNTNPNKIQKLINRRFISNSGAKVCIVAGDLGHYNVDNKIFLEKLKNTNDYETILFVTGNHELYNVSKNQRQKYTSTYDKFNELKMMIDDIPGVHFLDGDVVQINGVKFAGGMSWYDGSYYGKLTCGLYGESVEECWKRVMNDGNLIPQLKSFYDIFSIEIQKIKNVLKEKPDVMITHFSPISEPISFTGEFKTDKTSAFYAFDGEYLIDPDITPNDVKFWVHGHIHDEKKFEVHDTTILRNPFGYKDEQVGASIKTFEV